MAPLRHLSALASFTGIPMMIKRFKTRLSIWNVSIWDIMDNYFRFNSGNVETCDNIRQYNPIYIFVPIVNWVLVVNLPIRIDLFTVKHPMKIKVLVLYWPIITNFCHFNGLVIFLLHLFDSGLPYSHHYSRNNHSFSDIF